MKPALITLFLSLHFFAWATDTTFVVTENKELVWKKVYTSDFTFNELLANIKSTGLFYNVDTLGNSIFGEIKKTAFDINETKVGFWESDLPMYMIWSDFKATFVINYKPGKYQVTVKNITCIGKPTNVENNILILKPGEEDPITSYALKNNKAEIRKTFIKLSKPILDRQFDKYFSPRENDSNDF